MVMMGVTNFLAYVIPDVPAELKVQKRREIKKINDMLEDEEAGKRNKEIQEDISDVHSALSANQE